MGNVRALVADPAFARLPLAVRSDALRKVGAPDAFISDYVKLVNKGPALSPGPESEGFEDTSGDVASILERRHEPNRARDVGPKLAMFAAQGAMAGKLPGAAEGIGAWAAGLRGASTAAKAGATAQAGVTLAKESAKFYAADQGMKAVGVPGEVRAAVLTTAGVTRPGAAARGALRTIVRGKAAPAVAAAEGAAASAAPAAAEAASAAPAAAGAVKAEAEAITAQLLKWKEAGMSGGQMTASLRQVYGVPMKDATKLVKALQAAPAAAEAPVAAASGSLQPQRIQVGAQKVGREVGMTKEQVRQEAGPVLFEARGEASPLLPKEAFAAIAEKIKTLPRGEARDAYVALANSPKAMLSVEAIRRTLETQGLVLPFAAVAGLVIQAQEK